ncbi:hypothetical protein SOASR030_18870 [Leminorella grimontii]|uniref:Uncharacterized protein n=1 Tax=Leminorella grimontii TaxID=82981 RepID=A0AAV5N2K2_9GAMM|nr:hypothetical protein [Leminorella grimontii]KFC93530.1 hypothetical protein GLGR_3093 [Leminorella grimontii ATCC 33999 = DSM 5078]GKX55775.1 hypothetical protein SOASR030_18870 [Leminorella grimontii]VFS55205.1 Uncharacterised protein [Leminorella grimontii]
MDKIYTTEPIEFAFTENFFGGIPGSVDKHYVIINDINEAYKFAFEQNLPRGYKVWQDIIEQIRSSLRKNNKFQEADDSINALLAQLQSQNASSLIDYRKKKVKKINSKYDDFLFSEARNDAYFVLSTVAINRYLDNYITGSLLENVFKAYQLGGWPCGIKDESIVFFNPSSLII